MEFNDVWKFLHNSFNTVVTSFGSVSTFITSTLNDLVGESSNLPNWLSKVLQSILDSTSLGYYTVFQLLMGTGLTLFLGIAIIKFFREFI